MKSTKSHASLLPFATTTVMLLLNYPWLSIYSSDNLFFGIPPLFIYLFMLWLAFILTVRWLIRHQEQIRENDDA